MVIWESLVRGGTFLVEIRVLYDKIKAKIVK